MYSSIVHVVLDSATEYAINLSFIFHCRESIHSTKTDPIKKLPIFENLG